MLLVFSGCFSNFSGCLGAAHAASLLATVCLRSPPPLPLFFPSTDSISVDGCLEWGLMAGLRGFASHGSGSLSRGWLATVEALGYPRHPPSI